MWDARGLPEFVQCVQRLVLHAGCQGHPPGRRASCIKWRHQPGARQDSIARQVHWSGSIRYGILRKARGSIGDGAGPCNSHPIIISHN
jgi:hypothetical protein